MFDEFEKRGVHAIAIAQEDTDLESHGRFLSHFDHDPNFDIVADVSREQTGDYKRTTTYLINASGNVQQVFPGLIHYRGSWNAVLNEIDGMKPTGE